MILWSISVSNDGCTFPSCIIFNKIQLQISISMQQSHPLILPQTRRRPPLLLATPNHRYHQSLIDKKFDWLRKYLTPSAEPPNRKQSKLQIRVQNSVQISKNTFKKIGEGHGDMYQIVQCGAKGKVFVLNQNSQSKFGQNFQQKLSQNFQNRINLQGKFIDECDGDFKTCKSLLNDKVVIRRNKRQFRRFKTQKYENQQNSHKLVSSQNLDNASRRQSIFMHRKYRPVRDQFDLNPWSSYPDDTKQSIPYA